MLSAIITGLLASLAIAGNSCQPATWKRDAISPGDLQCRYWTPKTTSKSNCTQLTQHYGLSMDKFLKLNPGLDKECQLQPDTAYCLAGCKWLYSLFNGQDAYIDSVFEPLRAWDGHCGPRHENATCMGTTKQCCNSKTWTCGEREEDCRPGVCYEGACLQY